jgi:hypothetical protein
MLNATIPHEPRMPIEDLAEPDDEDNARAAARAISSAIAVNTVEPTA